METERFTVETGEARIGEARVYYQEGGSGPPLLLVHGLSGSSRWWKHNIEALTRHFHVFVIDLIGFGKSRGRHLFVLDEASDHLRDWMDQLGLDQASVVGHSMGGVIAMDLAAQYPERVRRLVLVDVAAFSLIERTLLHSATGLLKTVWYLPFGFLPILFTDALRAGPRLLWKAGRELLTADLQAVLPKIEAPTLIVWGEHDATVPLAVGEHLEKELPEAQLIVLEGAGHNPMWDQPADFNRTVLSFLEPKTET